ncbi:hypothetical protein [Nostoc sp. UHCC 0252]|uniref:hypothetical protein n=1 Tax=Nostoc sp. UHCC 0252 TaxID=3110241 RepID=UPI002B20CB5F|nr:hypothetical protein [Nostoc sp. UHCC 0252]MEA5600985.1 hypothetical protein [Nostoc sp. UHCC 0252]
MIGVSYSYLQLNRPCGRGTALLCPYVRYASNRYFVHQRSLIQVWRGDVRKANICDRLRWAQARSRSDLVETVKRLD